MILPADPQVLQVLHQHTLADAILRRRVLMHCLAHWLQEAPECVAWLQETRRVRLLPAAMLAPLAGDAPQAYLYKLLHQIANSRDYLALGVLLVVETDLADRPHSDMQHLRRGHIRTLADQRRIWVNACVVGQPSVGRIEKRYRIKT